MAHPAGAAILMVAACPATCRSVLGALLDACGGMTSLDWLDIDAISMAHDAVRSPANSEK